MPNKRNIKQLEDLTDLFNKSEYLVSTEYKDISANTMVALRKELNSVGAKYRIVKNNIAHLAANDANIPEFSNYITGTCALLITDLDPAQASKQLYKVIKDESLNIKVIGAVLNGEVIESNKVEQLSKLPSRDELIASAIGQIGAPLTGFVYSLSSQINSLVNVLNNIAESKNS